jgi:hypothetical protein
MDVNVLFHGAVVLFLAKESASTQFREGCVDPGGEGEKIRVSARKMILKKPLSKKNRHKGNDYTKLLSALFSALYKRSCMSFHHFCLNAKVRLYK